MAAKKKRYALKQPRPDVECPVCKRWVKGVRYETENPKSPIFKPWPHTNPETCTRCPGQDCVAKRVVQM